MHICELQRVVYMQINAFLTFPVVWPGPPMGRGAPGFGEHPMEPGRGRGFAPGRGRGLHLKGSKLSMGLTLMSVHAGIPSRPGASVCIPVELAFLRLKMVISIGGM